MESFAPKNQQKPASKAQETIKQAAYKRSSLAVILLIIELTILMPLLNSPMFMVALFNIPALLALVLCLSQTRSADLSTQKNIKLLLKIGIAKSLGGVLLAAFMSARFMSFAGAQDEEQYGVYLYMKKLTSFATMSAIVDMVYAVLAYFLVQYTRVIKKSL